jgi:hypothetical protein
MSYLWHKTITAIADVSWKRSRIEWDHVEAIPEVLSTDGDGDH